MVVLHRLLNPNFTDMFHSDASSTSSMQRRNSPSSPGSPGARRPKLLRACVTEPSLAASNVTRPSVLSSASPSRRATDLLSRVAVFGSSGDHPGSPRRAAEQLDHIEPTHDGCLPEDSICLCAPLDSGNYFSFPSFDTWDPETPEKGGEMAERSDRPG